MIFKKFLTVLALLLWAVHAYAEVDVNKASATQLEAVKGIGPNLSNAIVTERAKGRFKNWDDLISRVKRVGTKSAGKLSSEGLTVNGAAYSRLTAKAASKKATSKTGIPKKPQKLSASAPKAAGSKLAPQTKDTQPQKPKP